MNIEELINGTSIRALSWKQPYAELMLYDKIETRTWHTNYRGWVLMCTSLKEYPVDKILDISGEKQFYRMIDIINKNFLPPGHAFAIGRLVESRPMLMIGDEDKCFVEYNFGLNCHIYEDVQLIEPFPWKGCQGWKILSADEIQLIKLKPCH